MTIHIATSADLGRVVHRGLREPVRFVPDNWVVGPCASDPEVHARARCDYWEFQGRERTRFLASFREIMEAIDSRQPIVIWTSRLWTDIVALWALCAWRLVRSPAEPNLGLVDLGDPAEAGDATGSGGGFIRASPAGVRRSMSDMRSLSLTRVREMALFWRKLSGRSPILSVKADRAAEARKKLFELGEYQAGFLPRLGPHGLILSRFDELLFSCLAKRGSTPAELFVSCKPAGEELRNRWLSLTGDVFLAARLAQWANHNGSDAALTSEPYEPERRMIAARYRLSDTGHAMMRHGLTTVARGAPLPVWGVTAYDPLAPWVVVDDHAGRQQIQQLGGRASEVHQVPKPG
jgi:hypothetical protein